MNDAVTDLDLLPPSGVVPAKRNRRRERPDLSFVQTMDDERWFSKWFTGPSWMRWKVVGKVLFGEPLSQQERDVFIRLTNRQGPPPSSPVKEAWFVVGRRGGKSLIAAALAAFMASKDWSQFLKPGEKAVVMILAADKDQARVTLDYLRAFFEESPALVRLVSKIGRDSIRLKNKTVIQVQVASFRRLRGRTVVCAICDEISFWYNAETSSNPDSEILRALRPSMLTVPQSLLIAISSPYARRGVLWETHKRFYGVDDPRTLVWQADTVSMNPTVPEEEITARYEEDPAAARAEYGAEFRSDIESFLSPEQLQAVTIPGRTALPFVPGVRAVLFVDAAGGNPGGDSYTATVAYAKDGKGIVARLFERRPAFSPERVTAEIAEIAKEWNLTVVYGDAYAKGWPADEFRKHGIVYKTCDRVKSDLYLGLLPMITSGRVELLDDPRSLRQLSSLERKTTGHGRPDVTHPRGGHDDLSNAIAGALVLLGLRGPSEAIVSSIVRSTNPADRDTVLERNSAHIPRGVLGSVHPHLRDAPQEEGPPPSARALELEAYRHLRRCTDCGSPHHSNVRVKAKIAQEDLVRRAREQRESDGV